MPFTSNSPQLQLQNIKSTSQGLQDSRKTLFFLMETRFCSAASHGLVPKDPNDEET